MKFLSLFAFLLLFAQYIFGQTGLLATFGEEKYDRGSDLIETSQSQILISGNGSFNSLGAGFGFLALLDSNGTSLWEMVYGDSTSRIYSIAETNDGGFVFTGKTEATDSTGDDLWLGRIDSNGDTLWTVTDPAKGHEQGNAVLAAADGGFYVGGYTASFGPLEFNFLLAHFDSLGQLEWKKAFGGMQREEAFDMVFDGNGGIVLAGYTKNLGTHDLYLVHADSTGGLVKQTIIGDSSIEVATTLIKTNGGFVISGFRQADSSLDRNILLTKVDDNFDPVWDKTIGTTDSESANDLIELSNTGFLVTGNSIDGSGNSNMILVHADLFGQEVWSEKSGWENGIAAKEDQNGGFTVIGNSWTSATSKTDIVLVRTDATGVRISDRMGQQTFAAYPVPFSDKLNLLIKEDLEVRGLSFFDLLGKRKNCSKVIDGNRIEIDTHILKSGFWLLQIHFSDGSSETIKLLKSND